MMAFDPSAHAVHLGTRCRVRKRVAAGDLDEASADLIEKALDKSLPHGLCGFVQRLARALGATAEDALDAGSLAELAYAAVDLADDVEDGDAQAYLGVLPWPAQVNLATQLVALALAEAADVERRWGVPIAAEAATTLVRAACGQRVEILREGWSADSYVRAAEAMGQMLGLFMWVAAAAARREAAPLLGLVRPLGILFLIRSDEASGDPRWLGLGEEQMRSTREFARGNVDQAMRELPDDARVLVQELVTSALVNPRREA